MFWSIGFAIAIAIAIVVVFALFVLKQRARNPEANREFPPMGEATEEQECESLLSKKVSQAAPPSVEETSFPFDSGRQNRSLKKSHKRFFFTAYGAPRRFA